jgi:pimeloyl-ACP methyl ester carboxylesterase
MTDTQITIAHPIPPERVVLIPCSASSARQWNALAEQLAAFVPMPLDLWGHGDRPHWHGAGVLDLTAEAAAIGQACPDGAPFHLVGHSYGGAAALAFAASHPDRVRSLTLIEPSCFHILKSVEDSAHLLDEIHALAEVINRGVLCGDYRAGMQTFIDYWAGPGSWESLSETRKEQFARLTNHVAHHFCALLEEPTTLAAYAKIEVPTLILCGTGSPRPSRAITRLLADAMPRARHRTIPNAGHMSPITHPTEVNELVLTHVSTNSARTASVDRSHGEREEAGRRYAA